EISKLANLEGSTNVLVMRNPRAPICIEAECVVAARSFGPAAESRAAGILPVEEPLKDGKRVVRRYAVGVGAGADPYADLVAGHNGWLAGDLLNRFALQNIRAGVVHRVLYGPSNTERLHPLQRLWRCVVEVRDGPPQ